MDVLWAPWRSQYIQGFKDEEKGLIKLECFLCEAAVNDPARERELLVVARRKECFVMLNKFPYNGGHLLIAPYRHVGEIDELTDAELCDIMRVTQESTAVLKEISNPHGFNIGANLGRVAGAGVPGHLHYHVVPRWSGDTSCLAVISDTKVVSQSLDELQVLLAKQFLKAEGKSK